MQSPTSVRKNFMESFFRSLVLETAKSKNIDLNAPIFQYSLPIPPLNPLLAPKPSQQTIIRPVFNFKEGGFPSYPLKDLKRKESLSLPNFSPPEPIPYRPNSIEPLEISQPTPPGEMSNSIVTTSPFSGESPTKEGVLSQNFQTEDTNENNSGPKELSLRKIKVQPSAFVKELGQKTSAPSDFSISKAPLSGFNQSIREQSLGDSSLVSFPIIPIPQNAPGFKAPAHPIRTNSAAAVPLPNIKPLSHASISERENALGFEKLNSLLDDPRVLALECSGPGKPILVNRGGVVQVTQVFLKEGEIDHILHEVADKTRIPITNGIFKAALPSFIFTAVVSGFVGSRFIIQKKSVIRQN